MVDMGSLSFQSDKLTNNMVPKEIKVKMKKLNEDMKDTMPNIGKGTIMEVKQYEAKRNS